MNNTVLTILILALLLMSIIAPFSALSLLMAFVFVAALSWGVWTLVQTLIQGETPGNS